MRALIITVALCAVAVPAFAADTAKTTEPAPAGDKSKTEVAGAKPATPPDQKLICTKETPVGSNIIRKVCRTQAQVDADHANARELGDHRGSLSNGFGPPIP